MKKLISVLLGAILIPLIIIGSHAQTQNMIRTVIGSGGMVGISNSNGIKLNGQTGQNIIGTITNSASGPKSDFLNQGFWIPEAESVKIFIPHYNSDNYVLYYPNPASNYITIEYFLSVESDITFNVYNIVGKRLKTFLAGMQTSGAQKILLDLISDDGTTLAVGSYMIEMQARSGALKGAGAFNSFVLSNLLIIVK